jgi:hypothetical protein
MSFLVGDAVAKDFPLLQDSSGGVVTRRFDSENDGAHFFENKFENS